MKNFFLLVIVLNFNFSFSQNTIFWKVTKSGNSNTSYLLGTYHQMGNSYVDSLKTITRALKSSKVAVFENIDTGEGISKLLNSRQTNFEYKEKINKTQLMHLEKLAQEWTVPLSKLSPSELLLKLQQTYYETQCGTVKNTDTIKIFDNYLIKIAQRNSIELYGLESDSLITSYVNLAKGGDWKDLNKEIYQWLDNIRLNRNTVEYCALARNYKKQNLDYHLESECQKNVLISSRTAIWVPLIEEKIAVENSFVAVGLFHLFGKCGLIYELRQRGYNVEPVYNLDK